MSDDTSTPAPVTDGHEPAPDETQGLPAVDVFRAVRKLTAAEVEAPGALDNAKQAAYREAEARERLAEAEAKARQKVVQIKEVKFRPGTDTHDYDVKMRNVMRFLEDGDKVKVTLRFRGREMAHQDLGLDLLNRVRDDVGEAGKVESMPKLEGRQMVMMIAPR